MVLGTNRVLISNSVRRMKKFFKSVKKLLTKQKNSHKEWTQEDILRLLAEENFDVASLICESMLEKYPLNKWFRFHLGSFFLNILLVKLKQIKQQISLS